MSRKAFKDLTREQQRRNLIRRCKKSNAEIEQLIRDGEYWNSLHPGQEIDLGKPELMAIHDENVMYIRDLEAQGVQS